MRVRQETPADGNQVCFAFRNHLLRELRDIESPYRDHRNLDNLSYLCGHIDHAPVLLISRRMSPIPAVVATGVHVESVKAGLLQHSGHLEPLLNIAARLHIFFAGQSPGTKALHVVLQSESILNRKASCLPGA